MKASHLLFAVVMVASATSFAERAGNAWKNEVRSEGQGQYFIDQEGNKYCTHEGTRFAHSIQDGTLVVMDKETGKSAKYFSKVGFTKKGFVVSMKSETGDESLPLFIGESEQGTHYFNSLGDVQAGQLDEGFSFGEIANVKTKTYTLMCSKK